MKPKSEKEMFETLVAHGWIANFKDCGNGPGMFEAWPNDGKLLHFAEAHRAAQDATKLPNLRLLAMTGLRAVPRGSVYNNNWPVFEMSVSEPAREEKALEESEGDRLMHFFFQCSPSDPKKLPGPPKVIGRSWDELAGD